MSDSRTSSGQWSAFKATLVAAMVVGTIDQDATHAHLAHLAEGDFLRPHADIDLIFK
jgi:hypothetical protein